MPIVCCVRWIKIKKYKKEIPTCGYHFSAMKKWCHGVIQAVTAQYVIFSLNGTAPLFIFLFLQEWLMAVLVVTEVVWETAISHCESWYFIILCSLLLFMLFYNDYYYELLLLVLL
jgi:hypothetical protein